MYGLLNKGIEALVVNQYGEDTWEKIKEKAGFKGNFLNMEVYDDAVTYNLVGAATEVLNVDINTLLVEYGKSWVKFTMEKGYGQMLNMAGKDFPTFLKNLNNLHERVGHTYPKLKPPRFKTTVINDESLRLEYHSIRPGLAPVVEGILYGLGERFKISAELERTKTQDNDGFDEFLIHYQPLTAESENERVSDNQHLR